jgi:hypothetical protein
MIGSGGKNDVGLAGPVAGGATAFKLVGIVIGFTVRSPPPGILMSAYGGSRSIYTNFFGRGGKHLLSQGHDDGDRLRRSNRNSDLKQSLEAVMNFAPS